MLKVGLVTLGCDKNTVDSERYLSQLVAHGASHADDLSEAEVIIVNTCGFIDAAKKESIDAILEAARFKEDGNCKAVFAVGCMVQRHKNELHDVLPEVDVFLGTSESDRLIPELVERGLLDGSIVEHPGVRIFGGDLPHVRYLKVSEGCDHGCAFCAIPLMRGRHRSFSLDALIREAQLLEVQGAREVNLVAQDLAHYGRDIRNGVGLPELLEALVRETSIPWIRNLYLYAAGVTPRLLEVIAGNPRIVRYLDTPIQHGADTVLTRMRRPERQRTIRERLGLYRQIVPDLAIRTTVIVGFPGESDEEFETLLEFLEEMQFDRVGCFTFSRQEGTRAYDMPDDVPEAVKLERQEIVLDLQRAITAERYERFTGQVAPVLIERRVASDGAANLGGFIGAGAETGSNGSTGFEVTGDSRLAERQGSVYTGRAQWQADDIDGIVRLPVASLDGVAPGAIVDVRIERVVDDYDFEGVIQGVILPATSVSRRTARSLPMFQPTGGVTDLGISSYGR